ncbi:chemokine-like protein orion isoform X1 [Megachile rotundata]|uniref:chemokine-like protein orion isoform X1 n=1 Tax=Megachile rotundata TaxID=143995 RepID=UPI003FD1F3A3
MTVISTKLIFLCLLFTMDQFTNSYAKIGYIDVMELLKVGHGIVTDAFESWELIRPKDPEYDNTLPFVHRMEKELRNRISKVSRELDMYQQKLEIRMDTIMAKLLNDIPLRQNLDQRLRRIDELVGQIDDLYATFQMFVVEPRRYEQFTLEDFASTCVSSRSGALPDMLKTLHRLFIPYDGISFSKSVLVLLGNQMQAAASQICNENQSLQQLLYNLYTTITLSEIRGYSMVQFSYILLRLYNPGSNFTQEMAMVRQQYEMRTSETIRAVKTAMAFAPKDVWRCDVAEPKLDETYTYLNRLFQGYVVNEVDLNRQSTCRENCAYYSYSKVYGCYKNQFCQSQRKCNGKIVNCEYIDSDMWICPSSRESDRRYEYIEYENGNIFGQKKSCSNPKTKVDSWWRWIFWHCSYCFCYCDDSSAKSDRYFSLREVLSDVENNKVVTGIQLKKVNQIIHLQIKEGQLLPFGNINETNIQWKPVDAFSVLDTDVRKDVDYHTIMWEKRGVDLDVLEKDDNYLLTGVKFRTIGPRLNLEARFTPFNFTTGKLIDPVGRSVWVTNDVTDREKLKLEKPDIPTRQALLSLPDSKPNQYVNFEPSDRASDAAQNTIPFLDIQPVEPNPPVPLMGAGIYHKGRKGSGGYIAMKLVTYDFTRHLQADLPPAPPIINTTNEIQAV